MPDRRQTDEEFAASHHAIRNTIQQLCDLYDAGNPYIAFTLATEINKFLTTGDKITSIRKDKKFSTVKSVYRETNLASEHKIIIAEAHAHSDQNPPYYVDFKPAFVTEPPEGFEQLDFRDWWNRDVIWRASAAPDQSKPNMIPTDPKLQVPRNKRATYTRREIITLVRNRLGAHLDRELPEDLDNLQKSKAFGIDIVYEVDGRVLSSADCTLPMKAGPLAAMVRQIAQEVLDTFPVAQPQPS